MQITKKSAQKKQYPRNASDCVKIMFSFLFQFSSIHKDIILIFCDNSAQFELFSCKQDRGSEYL